MASAPKPFQVRIKRQSDQHHTPRLPSERDESSDSQASGEREDMQQAYRDIENGLVDTDLRGSLGTENIADAPQKLPADISGAPPDKPRPARRK
jgi:hypothetical protein